jgi:hypothetical protein
VTGYAITVQNKAGSGGSTTADILADGAAFTVKNLTNDAVSSSVGLNVNDFYQVTAGVLQDLVFKLSALLTNAATANLFIHNNPFSRLAEDLAGGTPGTFGTADIYVTEPGQLTGIITADGHGFYWEEVVAQSGANSVSNPWPANIRLAGQVSEAAGWSD